MSIELKITFESLEQAQAFFANRNVTTVGTKAAPETAPETAPENIAPTPDAAPETAGKRRGRPRKAKQEAPEPVKQEAAEPAKQETVEESLFDDDSGAEEPMDEAMFRAAVQGAIVGGYRGHAIELLKKFGVSKAMQLPQEKWGAFVHELHATMAANPVDAA